MQHPKRFGVMALSLSVILLFLNGMICSPPADAINILLTDGDVQTFGSSCDLPDCFAGSFLVGQDFALGTQSVRPISSLELRFGPVSPGQTIDLGGLLSTGGFRWTYQGAEHVTSNASFLNVSAAPVVTPEPDAFNLLGRPIFLDSPMSMSGILHGRDTVNGDLVDFNLSGFGIAMLDFSSARISLTNLGLANGICSSWSMTSSPFPNPPPGCS